MKYYKIKRQFVAHGKKDSYEFIFNELITQKEYAKICNQCGINAFKLLRYHGNFELIETNKNSTYWFFGCRFN